MIFCWPRVSPCPTGYLGDYAMKVFFLGAVFFTTFYVFFSLMASRQRKSGSGIDNPVESIRSLRLDSTNLSTLVLPQTSSQVDSGATGVNLTISGALKYVLKGTEERLAKKGAGKQIEARLRRAGLKLRVSEYLAVRFLSSVSSGVVMMVLGAPFGVAIAVSILGFWLPDIYVNRAIQKRLRKFVVQMPDALSIIANSLRSGHSFIQAIDVATNELSDPIASEFRQLVKETRVDIALEDALANLYSRVPVPEVQLVVTAVLIQRQAGGNLAGLIEQVGETVRMRLRFEGEVRSLSAQGRLSGWVIGLLPVFIAGAIAVMNPSYIGLLITEPLGKVMIGMAVAMELTGAFITSKMIRIEM